MAELFEPPATTVPPPQQRRSCRDLAESVDQRFFDERAGFYALALDGHKQPLRASVPIPGTSCGAGSRRDHAPRRSPGALGARPVQRMGSPNAVSSPSRLQPAVLPAWVGVAARHVIAAAGLFRYGHRQQGATLLRAVLDAACRLRGRPAAGAVLRLRSLRADRRSRMPKRTAAGLGRGGTGPRRPDYCSASCPMHREVAASSPRGCRSGSRSSKSMAFVSATSHSTSRSREGKTRPESKQRREMSCRSSSNTPPHPCGETPSHASEPARRESLVADEQQCRRLEQCLHALHEDRCIPAVDDAVIEAG